MRAGKNLLSVRYWIMRATLSPNQVGEYISYLHQGDNLDDLMMKELETYPEEVKKYIKIEKIYKIRYSPPEPTITKKWLDDFDGETETQMKEIFSKLRKSE